MGPSINYVGEGGVPKFWTLFNKGYGMKLGQGGGKGSNMPKK